MSFTIGADDEFDLNGNTGTDGDNGSRVEAGVYSIEVKGTHSSATTSLQANYENAGWVDLGSDTTFTADGIGSAEVPGCQLRVSSSGGGGGQNLSVSVLEVRRY